MSTEVRISIREIRVNPWPDFSDPRFRPNLETLGETTLQFEVNGQMFFVNFVPEEGRWYCYAPTPDGIQRIPVATDTAPFESFSIPTDERSRSILN